MNSESGSKESCRNYELQDVTERSNKTGRDFLLTGCRFTHRDLNEVWAPGCDFGFKPQLCSSGCQSSYWTASQSKWKTFQHKLLHSEKQVKGLFVTLVPKADLSRTRTRTCNLTTTVKKTRLFSDDEWSQPRSLLTESPSTRLCWRLCWL